MHDEAPTPAQTNCPHCQAVNERGAERCHACGRPPAPGAAPENPYAPPRSADPLRGPHTFHIGSLMLLIALIAVSLSLLVTLPGLGVVALLVLTPASVRTARGAWHDAEQGRRLDWQERLQLFAASLGVVLAIELGTIAAFVATCFPIGLFAFQLNSPAVPPGVFVALGAGVVAGGFVCFRLIRRLWPRRTRHAPARPHVPGDDPEPLP